MSILNKSNKTKPLAKTYAFYDAFKAKIWDIYLPDLHNENTPTKGYPKMGVILPDEDVADLVFSECIESECKKMQPKSIPFIEFRFNIDYNWVDAEYTKGGCKPKVVYIHDFPGFPSLMRNPFIAMRTLESFFKILSMPHLMVLLCAKSSENGKYVPEEFFWGLPWFEKKDIELSLATREAKCSISMNYPGYNIYKR